MLLIKNQIKVKLHHKIIQKVSSGSSSGWSSNKLDYHINVGLFVFVEVKLVIL